MVVFEPRSFCAAFFDVLYDIDTGELLEITADDTFVVSQLVSEGADRVGVVVFQVIEQSEAAVVEDVLSALPGKDERIREAVLREGF